MSKQIVIIGGGVSGLSVLHYLSRKYETRDDVLIKLLEKNNYVGGTAKTVFDKNTQFELGPNGFLDSKPSTLQLAKELNLESELLYASEEAKIRYISYQNKLQKLPTNPLGFITFKPLNIFDKFRVLQEFFISKGSDENETVHEFGTRRLGKRFADYLLDPMVAGVFGGDAKQLNLKRAFPRIHEIEQQYGSLFRGMFQLKKEREKKEKSQPVGQPKGQLVSFKGGMSQLCSAIQAQYSDRILTNEEVQSIEKVGKGYVVISQNVKYFADELFVCSTAYAASKLLVHVNVSLSTALSKVRYVPIAVVGLLYNKKDFEVVPKGFGYLNPSSEDNNILGVLFSGNIFKDRVGEDQFLFRIMIGGARNEGVLTKTEEELKALAVEEISSMFAPKAKPTDIFYHFWPKAIPQYDAAYGENVDLIHSEVQKLTNFHLVANYMGGVALNDCVQNAQKATEVVNI